MKKNKKQILAACNAICKDTLMETLEIEFIDLTDEVLVAKMPVTKRVHQPDGVLHGGATVALAESIGSAAAFVFLGNNNVTVRGLEIAANHIKSIKDGYVYARAIALHKGRTTQLWQIRIENENGDLISLVKLTTITPYVFTGFTLALLGAIDSLLTSIVADNMTKTKHDPNKELIGQGIGNSIASLFGGIPGAGATIRTVVNINSGGKTKLSGMIAGIMLLFILLALGPIASKIPTAVLSGILITVGIGVMDYKGLRAIPSLPKDLSFGPFKLSSEVIIMLTVLLLSTFWDLIFAVGIGLIFSCLMFMKKIGDLTSEYSNVKTLKEENWPDENNIPEHLKESVFIKHIKGPLFFGSTADFQQLYKQIPSTATTVILRLERMQYMDQSGLYAMEDMIQELQTKNIEVRFVDLLEQPRYMMERIDVIPEAHVYDCFDACIKDLS